MRILAADGRGPFDPAFLIDAAQGHHLWLFGSAITAVVEYQKKRAAERSDAYLDTVVDFLAHEDESFPPAFDDDNTNSDIWMIDADDPATHAIARVPRVVEMWGSRLVFGVPSRRTLEEGDDNHEIKDGALFIAGDAAPTIDVVAGRVVISPGFADTDACYVDVTLAKSGAVIRRCALDGSLIEERAFEKRRRPAKMSVQGPT